MNFIIVGVFILFFFFLFYIYLVIVCNFNYIQNMTKQLYMFYLVWNKVNRNKMYKFKIWIFLKKRDISLLKLEL